MLTIHTPRTLQPQRDFKGDGAIPQLPSHNGLGIVRRASATGANEDDDSCWRDVLTWGQKSRHACEFDIHWSSPNHVRTAQILLPILDSHYSEVLYAGEISVHFNNASAEFYARYFTHYLPLCPTSYSHILNRTQNPFLQGLARLFCTLENISDCQIETKELHSQLRHLTQQSKFQAEVANALAQYNRVPLTHSDEQLSAARRSAVAHQRTKERLYCLNQLLESQHYRLTHWRTVTNQPTHCTEIGLAAAKRTKQAPSAMTTFTASPHQTTSTPSATGENYNERI
jgi:maltooligosyltrehalose synthase